MISAYQSSKKPFTKQMFSFLFNASLRNCIYRISHLYLVFAYVIVEIFMLLVWADPNVNDVAIDLELLKNVSALVL